METRLQAYKYNPAGGLLRSSDYKDTHHRRRKQDKPRMHGKGAYEKTGWGNMHILPVTSYQKIPGFYFPTKSTKNKIW